MANHKSAAKRARQNIRRAAVNSATLNSVRTVERKLRQAVAAKDAKQVPELLSAYVRRVSKATNKGVIKRETAARKMARLSTLAQPHLS